MLLFFSLAAIALATEFKLVTANLAPLNPNLEVRNAQGASTTDTLMLLYRALSASGLKRDRNAVFKNTTSLDLNLDDTVLFSTSREIENQGGDAILNTGVDIVCTNCYIKGLATAQFTISGDFNFSSALDNVTTEITGELGNFSTAVVDYVDKYVDNTTTKVVTDGLDLDDFDFPPIEIDFDIDIPAIPECELLFQFDEMELYMQVDTILHSGATYTINLYTSRTPIGFAVGDVLIGIVFTFDLIIDVQTAIDINSGFHIQLNDGIAINIPIFNRSVSSITFNGGDFEFLPVTIKNAGIVINAILRLGIKAGINLGTPKQISNMVALRATDVEVGIEAGIWLDIAQFKTNITAAPATNGNTCELRVIEEYALAIGANAGARLEIGNNAWGPELEIATSIYYTTLTDACAVSKSTTPTPTPAVINARDDLETTTTVTEITYTATKCLTTGLVNCPNSLQETSKESVTKTLTATVKSGADAEFLTVNTIVSPTGFGANAHTMDPTSGSPVSYIPKPTTANDGIEGESSSESDEIINGSTKGMSNKVIIGVSVGIGLPVLIAIIASVVYFYRRRRNASIQNAEPIQHDLPFPEPFAPTLYTSSKKVLKVDVREYQPHT